MDKYIGFDVSLQTTHVCVVDSEGKTVREGIAASEVDALATWLRTHGKECREKSGVRRNPVSVHHSCPKR
jgi:hypothetical protein